MTSEMHQYFVLCRSSGAHLNKYISTEYIIGLPEIGVFCRQRTNWELFEFLRQLQVNRDLIHSSRCSHTMYKNNKCYWDRFEKPMGVNTEIHCLHERDLRILIRISAWIHLLSRRPNQVKNGSRQSPSHVSTDSDLSWTSGPDIYLVGLFCWEVDPGCYLATQRSYVVYFLWYSVIQFIGTRRNIRFYSNIIYPNLNAFTAQRKRGLGSWNCK